MVMTPASAHANRSTPGAPTKRADSADTMKMPDPIMEPTTSMVASTSPKRRSSAVEVMRDSLIGSIGGVNPCRRWLLEYEMRDAGLELPIDQRDRRQIEGRVRDHQ